MKETQHDITGLLKSRQIETKEQAYAIGFASAVADMKQAIDEARKAFCDEMSWDDFTERLAPRILDKSNQLLKSTALESMGDEEAK